MKINITARHFKARNSLQKYTNDKIELLGKYNEDILFADVVLSFDKPPTNNKHCEIIIKLKATVKIEKQLYKYKDKNKRQRYNVDKETYKTS